MHKQSGCSCLCTDYVYDQHVMWLNIVELQIGAFPASTWQHNYIHRASSPSVELTLCCHKVFSQQTLALVTRYSYKCMTKGEYFTKEIVDNTRNPKCIHLTLISVVCGSLRLTPVVLPQICFPWQGQGVHSCSAWKTRTTWSSCFLYIHLPRDWKTKGTVIPWHYIYRFKLQLWVLLESESNMHLCCIFGGTKYRKDATFSLITIFGLIEYAFLHLNVGVVSGFPVIIQLISQS